MEWGEYCPLDMRIWDGFNRLTFQTTSKLQAFVVVVVVVVSFLSFFFLLVLLLLVVVVVVYWWCFFAVCLFLFCFGVFQVLCVEKDEDISPLS